MNKSIIYFIGAMLLFSVSCTEDIDRFPLDTISEAAYFKSAADFKQYANGFYFHLESWNHRDVRSDLYRGRGQNSISSGNNTTSANNGTWDDAYKKFRGINYLINKAATFEDQDAIKTYLGEAYFFRAYQYFRLLRAFGGVPIVTRTLDTDSEELFQPRNSREEVFNLIVTDLETAISKLPSQSDISSTDYGRISKQAAQAFLARVTLFEGTYTKFRGGNGNALLEKAKNNAEAVINSGIYQLFKSDGLGDDFYRYMFTLDDIQQNPLNLGKDANKEYILINKYDRVLRIAPRNYYGFLDIASNPTKKFADMHLCKDGLPVDKSPLFQGYATMTSEYENRDIRMTNNFMVPKKQYWKGGNEFGRDFLIPDDQLGDPATSGGFIYFGNNDFGTYTLGGYAGYKFVSNNKETDHGPNYPVIRLAEVLLIYAEAVYEKDGAISDVDLDKSLNLVRERAKLPKLTNAFVTANDLDMREEIRRERAVELAWENQRFDDLCRWYKAHIDLNEPMLGVIYEGTEWATNATSVHSGPFNADGAIILEESKIRNFSETKHYLMPIPLKQIELNPALKQNPGW